MWIKSQNATYQWGYALRAVSDKPVGPFKVARDKNTPDGKKMGDFALYTENGKGYLIWAWGEEETVLIYELTDDFLDVNKKIGQLYEYQKREAPAIVKKNETYYLVTSGKSGWSPNPSRYATAPAIEGPWTDRGTLFRGPESHTSFRSQPTYLFENQGTVIYMGDRWNQRDLGNSRYIWLPVVFTNNGISITWKEEWNY
jgi:hypothetical protein